MRSRDELAAGGAPGKTSGATWEMAGIVLLALYVTAGVIYSAVLPQVARFPDEVEYPLLSNNLLHGPGYSMDGVHLTACRAPGYAFFLAGIEAGGGGYFIFRAAQFLLLGATIILLGRLCAERRMFAGLFITTGLVICYPLFFYMGGTLYPQIVSGFLFVLALALMLATPRGLALNLAAGGVFGSLVLVVPTFLFTLAVVLGMALLLKLVRWRDALWVTAAAALVVGAWTSRNAIVFHQFVPIASNSGANFLLGNNEEAKANEATANYGTVPYDEQVQKLGLDEFERDRFYRDAALTWIRTHPGDALVLYLEKVLNFFNITNVYSSRIHDEVTPWKEDVMAVSYLLLLGLLGWRLLDLKQYPFVPREKLLLAVYVLSAFTSAIFFTRIRHRLPYDFLIVAVIAFYLSRRAEAWMAAKRSSNRAERAGENE